MMQPYLWSIERARRRTHLIWTVAILIFYIPFALSVPRATGPIVWLLGDKWDWESSGLAGWNARNCGSVGFNTDARHGSKCVMTSLRNKVPFRVRYETGCIDEACSTGLWAVATAVSTWSHLTEVARTVEWTCSTRA